MTPENEKLVEAAMGYFELGMLDDAIAELASLGSRERLSVLSICSAALRMSERWPEMLSLTRKMVELYPADAECWVSLADATRNSVSVQAGLELLETARQHFPDDGHILFKSAATAASSDGWTKHGQRCKEQFPITEFGRRSRFRIVI